MSLVNKQVTQQTVTVSSTDAEHWKSTKGQAQIIGFLNDGWHLALAGKTLTRTKSIVIPTI